MKADAPPTAEPETKTEEIHRTTVHQITQRRASGEIHVPCIRIVGKWLFTLGFNHGDQLTVRTGQGKLSISTTPDKE